MDNINEIQFTKMEGAGNDYIYINLFNQTIENPSKLAITMSDRHFGIGGDGIVLISPSDVADVKMNMFNADGSESEMCGNAIRCVGKYVHDHKLVEKSSMQVETGAGILELDVLFDQETQLVNQAKVSMGLPELNATKIPSTLTADSIVDHSFSFQSGETSFELKGTLVSMGNPHFITFVDSVETTLVHEWGKIIENDPRFPNRINIEFVEIISRTEVKQRTWERGSGETLACGTGASAVCVAGVLTNKLENKILNHLLGGDLILEWKGKNHTVVMDGPAKYVFDGVWKEATKN